MSNEHTSAAGRAQHRVRSDIDPAPSRELFTPIPDFPIRETRTR